MPTTCITSHLEVTGRNDLLFHPVSHSVSGVNAAAHDAELEKPRDQATGLNKATRRQDSTLYKDATAVQDPDPDRLFSKSAVAVSKFEENSEVIMKGLDAVQRLHPFVGLVVSAFQAAIQLELTRRENDRKTMALKADMMNMMAILLDLRNIDDAQQLDPEGTTLEERMQRIVQDAERDIRDCSATCETYVKKKFVVRLFDGLRWEARLAVFSDTFAKRKAEFSLALSIHTAQGVHDVQHSLVDIEASVKTGSDSTAMLLLFHELESPAERELRKWITDKGGPNAVSGNEKLFKELQSKMKDIKGTLPNMCKDEVTQTTMLRVREEMQRDIDHSLARDRQQFDRKFDAVQDKLEEMRNTVRRSTDRILAVVTGGPHDRIRDIDLYTVWRDMSWRGTVKASHFVVAVQDYFLQKYSKDDQAMEDAVRDAAEGLSRAPSPALSMTTAATDDSEPLPSVLLTRALEARTTQRELEDGWAIDYISLARVRPIVEALDDHCSGWISVSEANKFTASRPVDYSVVKWLAFWAAGFPCLCARYAKAIENVRMRMVATSATVLPCNRARVDKYMCSSGLDVVDLIVRALRKQDDEDNGLMTHFNDYIAGEEVRLIEGLERFRWEIDAQNTLQIIAGTGRIERHGLPLILFLLQRHHQIMRLACKHPLDDRELWEAECSVNILADAVGLRISTLERHFVTHNLDPSKEFEFAYNGMFKMAYMCLHRGESSVYNWEYPELSYNSDEDDLDDKILKYAATEDGVPAGMYRDIGQDDEIPTDPFDGLWTGTYSYGEETMIRDGVVSAHLYSYDEAQSVFAGSGRDGIGSFEISGNITAAGSPCEQRIWFKKEYRQVTIMDQAKIWAYRGAILVEDSGRMTVMTGEWGPWVDDPLEFRAYGTFKMDRTPAIVARHRPSVAEFEKNAARARWKLALNVVEEQIRQKLLSWNHYRQRRDDRKKFVDAYVHAVSGTNPRRYRRTWTNGDGTRYDAFKDYFTAFDEHPPRLRAEDLQFYRWIANDRLERECFHLDRICNSCRGQIVGARYRCLDCTVPSNPGEGVDLCEECKDNGVFGADKNLKHIPEAHTLLKTLRVIHRWREALIVRRGWEHKEIAKKTFANADMYLHLRSQDYIEGQENSAGNAKSSDQGVTIPACFYCQQHVSRPCWSCVECWDTFICDECEASQEKISKRTLTSEFNAQDPHHKWHHVLVRVKDIVPKPPRMELDMQLSVLEQKIATHESVMRQKLDDLATGIAGVNEKVEKLQSRFSAIEGLLTRLVAKMG
ncbi:hypothetical protein FB451DRAFT_1266995 [Mycena latifolia]|nr:hypothetical protein FB451DRAFT_1266995 [Mycena latifolia]